jgi:His-Xaa-Ser system radical SAM maturase HxsC
MRLWSSGTATAVDSPVMGRLTCHPRPLDARRGMIAFVQRDNASTFSGDWAGYNAVLASGNIAPPDSVPSIVGVPNLDYLADDDVVHLYSDGTVQVLYRRRSEHNSILLTERCNSACLMCSQPPREVQDDYRVDNILQLFELVSPETRELGLTGGEPTLLGDGLLRIVQKGRDVLPNTGLHLLTNGRLFKDAAFAAAFGAIKHPDLMLGIPLYSDVDWRHDYVVQAKGAYDETLEGLYNLAMNGVPIQLRVVLHAQTVDRLPRLAEFIVRNIPFVHHVALMGLEMFGYTLLNLNEVWIDPAAYAPQLEAATRALVLSGIETRIFNHQLCTIPRSVWPFAVKSISDWKNVYLPECESCSVKTDCGGFFQSATKRHSAFIAAVQ